MMAFNKVTFSIVGALTILSGCGATTPMDKYRELPSPRYYATSDYYNYGWSSRSFLNEPHEFLKNEALMNCQQWSAFPCFIHMKNDEVVQPVKERVILPAVNMEDRPDVLAKYKDKLSIDYKDQTYGGKDYIAEDKRPNEKLRIIKTKELFDRMVSGEEIYLFLPRRYYTFGILGGYMVNNLQERAPRKFLNADLEAITEITGGRNDVPIVFYDWDGVRHRSAYEAAKVASKEGFTNVYWYRGGMRYWDAYRLPLQKMPVASK